MNNDNQYGLPTLKKYPMPDIKHVKSAIKFFNYVDRKHEKELANAILSKIEEYGIDISDFNVGENNRFKKYLVNDTLTHHGILGQRWGVRRFQNEDGTRTAAGKKRYSVDIEGAQKKLDKERKIHDSISAQDTKALSKQNKEIGYAKEDLKSEQIKDKINSKGGLTKTQKKYQAEYQAKGMTEEEAAVAAYKRDVARKALMIGAGVAITAVGAYAGYKYGQYACDSVLKKGTALSRIAQNDQKGVQDAFYAVLDKNTSDKNRYGGIYGSQLKARGRNIFEKKIGINADLKIASPKHSAEIMGKALDHFGARDNPEEIANVRNLLKNYAIGDRMLGVSNRAKMFDKASKEFDDYLKTGKVGRNLYDALNVNLADHNSNITKQFYKELRNAGYSGIKDMNDAKYSGFMTKLPVIIADTRNVSVDSVRQVRSPEIETARRLANSANAKKVLLSSARQNLASLGIGSAAGGAALAVNNSYKTSKNNKLVEQYRKDHPNTKMSYTDIVRMYERQRNGA